MKNKWIALFMLFGITLRAGSQEAVIDTVMNLDTLSIKAERYAVYSSGQKVRQIYPGRENINPGEKLSGIIHDYTSIYIRSYGQASISSMSIRGTSSAQSGVFWNGINLRMPSLGSTDLSLIPATFFNNISIVYGGSSMRYGSGTIGGAVYLDNHAEFERSTQASAEFAAGSFGAFGTSASFRISDNKYYIRVGINSHSAENDFEYNSSRGEELRMSNAATRSLGLQTHAAIRLGEKNQADLMLWYQEANREVPPTTSMVASEAYQADRAIRSSLQWKTYFVRGVLNIKTAWFSEYENYTNPLIGLSSKINTSSWYAETEYRRQVFTHGSFNAGFSANGEIADITAYREIKERTGLAAFLNYRHFLPKIHWTLLAGARQEVNDHTLAPFTPSVGTEGPLIGILSHKLSISRNYRLPTMNELYWQPGGNPDIEPEESWNAEFSLLANVLESSKIMDLELSATAYTSYVENWILWTPVNIFWAADNIQEVWSRGLEADAVFKVRKGPADLLMKMSYTFSKSTIEGNSSDAGARGSQLIYTPLNNAAASLQAGYQSWQLNLKGHYTGRSYTNTDNTAELPGFFITDLKLNKQFRTKTVGIKLSFMVRNIFDVEYQVVAYRPMPGRHYQLSLFINLKNKKHD